MYSGQFVFSQVMEHLPMKTFRRCVQRNQGDRRVQSFTWEICVTLPEIDTDLQEEGRCFWRI